jgi:hypothetical protein
MPTCVSLQVLFLLDSNTSWFFYCRQLPVVHLRNSVYPYDFSLIASGAMTSIPLVDLNCFQDGLLTLDYRHHFRLFVVKFRKSFEDPFGCGLRSLCHIVA